MSLISLFSINIISSQSQQRINQMMNLPEKRVIDGPDRRNKNPICNQKKDNVARICSNNKCTNDGNQIMCGLNTCACNEKTHSNCYEFINFNYLINTAGQIQKIVYKDLFDNVLKTLHSIAQTAIKRYNQTLKVFDIYMMPKPIENAVKSINGNANILKKQAINLKQYFNEFPEFKLPELNHLEEYKKGVKQIQESIKQHIKISTEFYKKLNLSLVEHQKNALSLIEDYNIKQKKQRNIVQRSWNRNQSRSNSR